MSGPASSSSDPRRRSCASGRASMPNSTAAASTSGCIRCSCSATGRRWRCSGGRSPSCPGILEALGRRRASLEDPRLRSANPAERDTFARGVIAAELVRLADFAALSGAFASSRVMFAEVRSFADLAATEWAAERRLIAEAAPRFAIAEQPVAQRFRRPGPRRARLRAKGSTRGPSWPNSAAPIRKSSDYALAAPSAGDHRKALAWRNASTASSPSADRVIGSPGRKRWVATRHQSSAGPMMRSADSGGPKVQS